MKVIKLERIAQLIQTTDELGRSQRAPLLTEVERLVEEPIRYQLKEGIRHLLDTAANVSESLAQRLRREPCKTKEKTYTGDEVLDLLTGSWNERDMLETQDRLLFEQIIGDLHDDTFDHLMEDADYLSSDDIEELVEWVLRAIQDILNHRLALLQAEHRRMLLTASLMNELITVGQIAGLKPWERTQLEKACKAKELWW